MCENVTKNMTPDELKIPGIQDNFELLDQYKNSQGTSKDYQFPKSFYKPNGTVNKIKAIKKCCKPAKCIAPNNEKGDIADLTSKKRYPDGNAEDCEKYLLYNQPYYLFNINDAKERNYLDSCKEPKEKMPSGCTSNENAQTFTKTPSSANWIIKPKNPTSSKIINYNDEVSIHLASNNHYLITCNRSKCYPGGELEVSVSNNKTNLVSQAQYWKLVHLLHDTNKDPGPVKLGDKIFIENLWQNKKTYLHTCRAEKPQTCPGSKYNVNTIKKYSRHYGAPHSHWHFESPFEDGNCNPSKHNKKLTIIDSPDNCKHNLGDSCECRGKDKTKVCRWPAIPRTQSKMGKIYAWNNIDPNKFCRPIQNYQFNKGAKLYATSKAVLRDSKLPTSLSDCEANYETKTKTGPYRSCKKPKTQLTTTMSNQQRRGKARAQRATVRRRKHTVASIDLSAYKQASRAQSRSYSRRSHGPGGGSLQQNINQSEDTIKGGATGLNSYGDPVKLPSMMLCRHGPPGPRGAMRELGLKCEDIPKNYTIESAENTKNFDMESAEKVCPVIVSRDDPVRTTKCIKEKDGRAVEFIPPDGCIPKENQIMRPTKNTLQKYLQDGLLNKFCKISSNNKLEYGDNMTWDKISKNTGEQVFADIDDDTKLYDDHATAWACCKKKTFPACNKDTPKLIKEKDKNDKSFWNGRDAGDGAYEAWNKDGIDVKLTKHNCLNIKCENIPGSYIPNNKKIKETKKNHLINYNKDGEINTAEIPNCLENSPKCNAYKNCPDGTAASPFNNENQIYVNGKINETLTNSKCCEKVTKCKEKWVVIPTFRYNKITDIPKTSGGNKSKITGGYWWNRPAKTCDQANNPGKDRIPSQRTKFLVEKQFEKQGLQTYKVTLIVIIVGI